MQGQNLRHGYFGLFSILGLAGLAGCLLGNNAPADKEKAKTIIVISDTGTPQDTAKTTKTDTIIKVDTVTKTKTDTVVTVKPIDVKPVDPVVTLPPVEPPPAPTILTQMLRLEPTKLGGLGKRSISVDTGVTGPHWSSDFRLTSFKTPITRIVLENIEHNRYAEIFTCRTGNCLVELVGDQLEDILGAVSAEIQPGTYTSVNFNYCRDGESGYESHVTGDVELDGRRWHTKEGTSMTLESPATASRIHYSGCGRSFPLPRPVIIAGDTSRSGGGDSVGNGGDTSHVACWRSLFDSLSRAGINPDTLEQLPPGLEGRCPGEPPQDGGEGGQGTTGGLMKRATGVLIAEPVRFRLFYDIDGIVWAGLNEPDTKWAWAPGNCTGPHPDESMTDTVPYICAGYPDIAGTSDSTAPTLERYYLNESSVFGLFFNSDDTFIGGYSRRYLVQGSSRTPGFEPVTPIRFFTALGGGAYHFANYGSSVSSSYFETNDFRREAHSGSYTVERGTPGDYSATLSPPSL